jgi:predicted nucleic acid-binding protein
LTVYLDTSALIKVFLAETGSAEVRQLLEEPIPRATSRITYVECHAAFARGRREGRLAQREVAELAKDLDRRWEDLLVVELDAPLGDQAAALVQRHFLRASDAIHLASAAALPSEGHEATTFACWDRRLWEAAGVVGLTRVPQSFS